MFSLLVTIIEIQHVKSHLKIFPAYNDTELQMFPYPKRFVFLTDYALRTSLGTFSTLIYINISFNQMDRTYSKKGITNSGEAKW